MLEFPAIIIKAFKDEPPIILRLLLQHISYPNYNITLLISFPDLSINTTSLFESRTNFPKY